jgi:hypothetical protein
MHNLHEAEVSGRIFLPHVICCHAGNASLAAIRRARLDDER